MTPEQRYRAAISNVLEMEAGVMAVTNAKRPLTRYPLRLRLWWRLVGVPADVRALQLRERKERAELFLEGMSSLRAR